jgi:hypothetical protein
MLASGDFNSHKCSWALKGTKEIPVVYFRDDSFDDKKIMTGYGIDGVLYSFVVVPREAIPLIESLSRRKVTDSGTDEEVTEPFFRKC